MLDAKLRWLNLKGWKKAIIVATSIFYKQLVINKRTEKETKVLYMSKPFYFIYFKQLPYIQINAGIQTYRPRVAPQQAQDYSALK